MRSFLRFLNSSCTASTFLTMTDANVALLIFSLPCSSLKILLPSLSSLLWSNNFKTKLQALYVDFFKASDLFFWAVDNLIKILLAQIISKYLHCNMMIVMGAKFLSLFHCEATAWLSRGCKFSVHNSF